jgi:hypothetical protein
MSFETDFDCFKIDYYFADSKTSFIHFSFKMDFTYSKISLIDFSFTDFSFAYLSLINFDSKMGCSFQINYFN